MSCPLGLGKRILDSGIGNGFCTSTQIVTMAAKNSSQLFLVVRSVDRSTGIW